jgi:Fe-S-cluster containining protein
MGILSAIFGPRIKLPRDQTTKVPRAVKKRAREHIDGMQKAIDEIGAMPGIADVGQTKRLPRGFSERVEVLLAHYDQYADEARNALGIGDLPRAGTPEGVGACYAAPMGVSGVEALAIYRLVRTWNDFQTVAQRMGELAELQMNDIQALHEGKDPEKIRATGKPVQQGRVDFSRRGEPCPFLDRNRRKCRLGDAKPIVCRMHHIATDPAWSNPQHPRHGDVKAKNIRLPIRQQVALQQIDKRMALQLSPFLYVNLLQLLQLAEGELIAEVGEAPRKMQQDGRVAGRANRNVKHAAKFKKGKKGKGKKRK